MMEFYCHMCQEHRFVIDLAFTYEVNGKKEGVCGFCAGCYDEC